MSMLIKLDRTHHSSLDAASIRTGPQMPCKTTLSFGIAYWEKENLSHTKCLQSCNNEKGAYRHQACHARCNLLNEEKEHEEYQQPPHHEEGHQHGEGEEGDESKQPHPFPFPYQPHQHEDEPAHERHHKKEGEEEEKEQHHESEGSEGSESQKKQKNPFHFSSNRFHTLFNNQNGHIRLLQRFDQQSKQLQNLEDFRLLEFQSKPNTLLLPHHADADYIIIILSGRAILTLVKPDDRDSYNLHCGDVQKIPAGTTFYLVNPDNKETLKVIALARPVNNPGKLETFFLSSTEAQQSYLQGFSKNTLEASFDSQFKEIKKVLFGEEGHQQYGQESQQEGVIVELSKEHIQELSRHAKSSSRKTISSEDEPFNLKSRKPIYSNKFGKFYEITPEKNPQLRDLDVSVGYVDMNEVSAKKTSPGGLLLPHYNSKAIMILGVNKGEAKVELVGLRKQQQQYHQEESMEVQRYGAELSEDDIFVIPADYPVAINAISNLKLFAFGINAENNQRNFLAGEKENVLSEIPKQVLEVAFPGSGKEVEKLIEKQKESYFVDAEPQEKEEGHAIGMYECEIQWYCTMLRARVPLLLLLLGILFLASVSVSFANVHRQKEYGKEGSYSGGQNNPFFFSSDRSFLTLYKNEYGHIRVLQRFDQRSKQLQNLEDYRLVEFKSKPNTLLLPHHADAEFLLVVLSGKAILTVVNPDGRDSYILESGHIQKIPAGTVFYLINPDDNENLRLIKLAVPVNNPHKFQNLFLSSTKAQQSYLQGFSKNILEASFDSEFEEINRVLFGEEGYQHYGEESQSEGVIVKLSNEQIRELCKHAKSGSRKALSSQDEPFNLRNHKPIYSNKFGKFYEITPEKNPQLRDLDVSVSYVDMNEGGLLLPHYNSKAIMILGVNKGEAKVELVGLRKQQQQDHQEESMEVQRYGAELSEDDIFVIPADYPVAINAISNLKLFAFGINAENNQRNFLAGEKENVLSEIPKQVLEVAFPGSGKEVEKLIEKQKESYFVDAEPQEKEEGHGKGRKGPFVRHPNLLQLFGTRVEQERKIDTPVQVHRIHVYPKELHPNAMHNNTYSPSHANNPKSIIFLCRLNFVRLDDTRQPAIDPVAKSENPNGRKCVEICESEKDPSRVQTCKLRCKHVPERGEKEEEREISEQHPSHEERGDRERGYQEGEKKEEGREGREQPRPYPPPHSREYEREKEQWKGWHRREDPEERARVRQREEEIRERKREEEIKERERQREGKPWRREKKEKWEEIEEVEGFPESDSLTQINPFHFSSNRFRTLFKNQLGHIRVLQMFDQWSSKELQSLQDYRVVEFNSKPNTLLLPHHADADFLLVVLSGRALINFVKPDDRDTYYLDPGYAQIIPAGTTFYLVNPDRKKNLRVIKLAIPVNKPRKFENFFLSSTQDQQSYLQGFGEDILEASFDSTFEEINKVLFGEERPQQDPHRRQQEGVIVELSNEKIRELSKSAKSSSRKTHSFEYEPFDLRSSNPIYSNKFGAFYEITPEENTHLRELNILLNSVDINKGGLLLPHYNSKAPLILVVNKGEATVELVGLREQQKKQQEEEEESREVKRYRAKLSEDDIFVIPAAYPVSINATTNLNFLALGINAKNNQRNFLAGEKDNVISEIGRQVLEVAFPGSGEDVEKLIKKQRESYFVDARPETGKKGRKDPLSSILGALY
ncbi:unnamed protein product [Sphenostylis stenocarpa]|uniref:Cupin type-1 domain-containing protein n=1 Tax=Sphenostylis stenocarpa TaxID=92480 RepID=A0AA86W2F3_9FABA|nr:unnamed protein product [Sphenostylis stenocarpa]